MGILDFIHNNVCIMDGKYLGCGSFFVTFIDDHFKKVWAFIFVKSLTSDNIWPKHVLISEDNPHPISRFCKNELGRTLRCYQSRI